MLVLTRRKGESLQLFIKNELIAEVTIVEVGKNKAIEVKNLDYTPVKIGLQIPDYVKVLRSELSRNN